MTSSPNSKPIFETVRKSVSERLMRDLNRLNESMFVQSMNDYLNHLMFPAQVASLGYYALEWTMRKYECTESEKKESDEEKMEEVTVEEIKHTLPIRKETRKNSSTGHKEIEELIEEERKLALIHEQQEAWILELTSKKY